MDILFRQRFADKHIFPPKEPIVEGVVKVGPTIRPVLQDRAILSRAVVDLVIFRFCLAPVLIVYALPRRGPVEFTLLAEIVCRYPCYVRVRVPGTVQILDDGFPLFGISHRQQEHAARSTVLDRLVPWAVCVCVCVNFWNCVFWNGWN